MLIVAPRVLATIVEHARREAPIEACGYLAERDGVVCRAYPLTNADAVPNHFSLAPAEQFAAVRAMRAEGMKLRAVYHSHPVGPALMSAEDVRLAADASLSYVVISLAAKEAVVKSFVVADGCREEMLATDVAGRSVPT